MTHVHASATFSPQVYWPQQNEKYVFWPCKPHVVLIYIAVVVAAVFVAAAAIAIAALKKYDFITTWYLTHIILNTSVLQSLG